MQKPQGNKTEQKVYELAGPLAESLGLHIWDVRFVKEGGSFYLRIFIDKEGGVFISDCEELSKAVDPLLDEADLISQSYCLEVSSPGLGRALTRPEHFAKMRGEEVRIRLIRPRDGLREFTCRLKGYDEHMVTVEMDDGSDRTFHLREDIAYIKLNDDDIGGF